LKRPRCKWDSNIRIDRKGTGCECVGWMNVAQDRDQCRALWTR